MKWYESFGDPEPIFAEMRRIGEKATRYYNQYQRLMPRGREIALGGEHFDEFVKGEALSELLRGIRNGYTPQAAVEAAKSYVHEIVSKWNKNPQAASVNGKHELQRWVGMADSILEDAMRALLRTAESITQRTEAA